METKDQQGEVVRVGDRLLVLVDVIDIVQAGDTEMIVGVTSIKHQEKQYGFPVFHGSQAQKVTT